MCGNCTSNGFPAIPDLQGYTIGQLGHEQWQGGSVSCGPFVQTGIKSGSDASDSDGGRPWYGTNAERPMLLKVTTFSWWQCWCVKVLACSRLAQGISRWLLASAMFASTCLMLCGIKPFQCLTQDNGEVQNFRYKLQPKQRVHTFEPKPLPADADLHQLRASQLGTVFFKENKVSKLPANAHCALTWDVFS